MLRNTPGAFVADPLNIALTMRLDDASIALIQAVDPRIRILDCSALGSRTAPEGEARQQILGRLAEAEIALGPNRLSPEYFDAAPRLKWFQAVNAGIDRMDRLGLLKRGFTVTTAAGLASASISEYVLGSMIMLAKAMNHYGRAQTEHRWQFKQSAELSGKTCGVVGLGAIGRDTGKRARAFNMRIVASRRTVAAGATDPGCDLLLPYSELSRLLGESDYVVLAVPLTLETRHLIGAAEFAAMKPTASIINVARGEVIDQEALMAALRDGTIAGAALDVTDPEPLPAEHPLWDFENAIITPHVSGAVENYGYKAAALFADNLRRYLANEPLKNVAKPELGY
jgi:D-2-hydroxyacid dehydrogenase (NADP+)